MTTKLQPLELIRGIMIITLIICANSSTPSFAEDSDFESNVAPILQKHCLRCHSDDHAEGDLSFSSHASFRKGGASGVLISKESPAESLLLDQISGAAPAMPAEGTPLTAEEVDAIRSWVNDGAHWPETFALKAKSAGGKDWWSFQPIQRAVVPEVSRNEWAKNPIDRFILAKLEANGLSPSAEADRRTLIRRLTFDLHGIPPTYAQVESFVNDSDPQAYEKLVDRLLASEHYGERWARHWLDIAHYADTHGFERDQLRPNAWRYRDYVIQSLNADKSYREFLQEQIAGDALRPEAPEAIIASSFLAAGPWDFVGQVETGSPELKRAARADDLDDMVTQVISTTMGLTINCARCHDHKLDPITQREYYQLWSLFAGVRRGDRDSDPVSVSKNNTLKAQLEATRNEAISTRNRLQGDPILLADIVGGGNGRGTGKYRQGIDPVDGTTIVADRNFVEVKEANKFVESPLELIDGVTVPNGTGSGTQISSTGIRVTNVPATSGMLWDGIRNGPVTSMHSTELGGIDYGKDGHSMLSMHANSAITFDLQKLRESGFSGEMSFHADVGYFGVTPQAGASYFIYLDGDLKEEGVGIGRNDGIKGVQFEISTESRFLTLMVTDFNQDISHDQIAFCNAKLVESNRESISEEVKQQITEIERQIRDIDKALSEIPQPDRVYGIVVDDTSPAIHILRRGNPEDPGDVVSPAGLECLSGLDSDLRIQSDSDHARRIAMAEWITQTANPLTRRVIVNRLWHHHFGVGIVDTPSDFGFGGGVPTHPELLDWLADEFLHTGWSLKKLHRLICNSATYRQTSNEHRPAEVSVDSGNRLLWRMNPRKLDAESIWDSTLFVAGNLNLQQFGPGFRDFDYFEEYAPVYRYIAPTSPDLQRRSIYRFIVRTTPHELMSTLDCPSPSNMTPVRTVTTTALQSLAMFNNEFVLLQSQVLAERVIQEAEDSSQSQVITLFRLTLGRDPTNEELNDSVEFLQKNRLVQLCRVLLNTNEFLSVD
ncbi:DUF1553 domain-containing protein [Planctomicrobium sp. SH668]|uniref:DUF1553 domain-containing protein n=1 Tax=Planctomicrobium sp. SH668 TaxID=3448126 RepID=UPI003F5B5D4D